MSRLLVTVCVLVCVLVGVHGKLRFKNHLKQSLTRAAKYMKSGLAERQAVGCTADQFACPEKCVPQTYVCDTENDCSGGYDESQNCPANCTGPNQFQCPGGRCIPVFYRCDG
ncbi:unnamed protein product, partial [Lymnaea stagnalis]